MDVLGFLLVGLIIGTVSGTLGIGGGVLLIPVLMWVFGFDQRKAIGTSIGVFALPIGILAAWQNYARGTMDLRATLCIALSFVFGAFVGALLMPHIPKEALRVFFGFLLLYIGVHFIMASDQNVASALVGLLSVAVTAAAYVALRALGRRYQPRRLADEIGRFQQQNPHEPDYYI